MPSKPYRVISSNDVNEEFVRTVERAEAQGRSEFVTSVAKSIMNDLMWKPHEVGESREELAFMRLSVRCILRDPLTVVYAINEPDRIVYVQRIILWPM